MHWSQFPPSSKKADGFFIFKTKFRKIRDKIVKYEKIYQKIMHDRMLELTNML